MRSVTRPQALAGTSSVERYMARTTHRDRFSNKEPSPRGLASYEVNAGAAVSFSPGANYFRDSVANWNPERPTGARRYLCARVRPLAPYPRQGTLVTSRMEVRSALGPAITRAGGMLAKAVMRARLE